MVDTYNGILLSLKKMEILSFVTCKEVEGIMLRKISQSQKNKCRKTKNK